MATPVKFSVVIPAYNASATIVDSIQSVLEQTYPAYEIIVVNDGSSDDTEAILEKHFGISIKTITLQTNSGPSVARNTGLEAATGTHIAFQDADDTWHKEKLFYVAAILEKYREVHFLFHPYTLSEVDFPVTKALLELKEYPMWKLLGSNPIGTPCVVISREKVLRFNENLHHMEDYELFLREAALHKVFRIPAPFTKVGRPILSRGGQSSRRWKMRMGEIRAWWYFAKFRPAFAPAMLPLMGFALIKHVAKAFFPPRTNY